MAASLLRRSRRCSISPPAALVELTLPLATSEARRAPRREWLHLAMAGALFGTVVASASRAGAVLVTIEILALPLLGRSFRAAAKVISVSLLFAALATAV